MPETEEQQLDLLEPTPPQEGELMPQSEPSPPAEPEDDSKDLFLDMEPLRRIADGKTVRVPRNPNFSRKDVVNAFQSAFELVGGVPRLALWANENYTEFAKLYARLLPSNSSSALGEANVLRIEMAVPDSPLDHQGVPEATHAHQKKSQG